MVLLRKLVMTGAALAASTLGALAADMSGDYRLSLPPPTYQDQPPRRVELSSGWYLRGDLGYRFQHIGSSSTGDATVVPVPDNGTIKNNVVGGIGAGIKMQWLRLDLTGDYAWRSPYSATTTGGGTLSGKIESFTVMANGYFDLGTWYGITPYLGAGIGAANLNFSGYTYPTATAPMASTAVPVQRWNLAWAAMAGLTYPVAPNILLDVSYRHIDMGDVTGGPAGQLTVKKLTGDEIRVGFRYLLD